jgi:GTPase SAR1 family protein
MAQQLPQHDPRTDDGTVAMRDLYMKTGQGFLLVFSITSSSSLSELAGLREEIIRIKDDENVPLVIVGNKADLEENRAVPRAKGFSISQRWGAPYYEASARTRSEFSFSAPAWLFVICRADDYRIRTDKLIQQTLKRSLLISAGKCCAGRTNKTQTTAPTTTTSMTAVEARRNVNDVAERRIHHDAQSYKHPNETDCCFLLDS